LSKPTKPEGSYSARYNARLAVLECQVKELSEIRDDCNNRMDLLIENIQSKIDSNEKATVLAKDSMENRLTAMNEFRATLSDQNKLYTTKTDHLGLATKLETDTNSLRNEILNTLTALRNELNIRIEKVELDIRELRESKALLAGKASQNSVTIAYVTSFIGIVFGLVGLLRALLGT
jgi:chromosome segregation ATPase